jgi:hypothetical protein
LHVQIPTVNKAQAEAIFAKYGLPVIVWRSCSMESGKATGMICDYTKLEGYAVAYTCEIRMDHAQVHRFNVVR